jgi:GTP-binding protein
MPGIIDGAHTGTGLGLQFLRHIERVRLLLHFVDSSLADNDMISKYLAIRRELELYSRDVAIKPEIVVAAKVDAASESLESFAGFIEGKGKPFFTISSVTGEGLPALMTYIGKAVRGN